MTKSQVFYLITQDGRHCELDSPYVPHSGPVRDWATRLDTYGVPAWVAVTNGPPTSGSDHDILILSRGTLCDGDAEAATLAFRELQRTHVPNSSAEARLDVSTQPEIRLAKREG